MVIVMQYFSCVLLCHHAVISFVLLFDCGPPIEYPYFEGGAELGC